MQTWRQVLTWSSSARQPFRLIDRTPSAGEKYCAAEMISAVTGEISCRCVFTQCCWVTSFFLFHLSFFFSLSSEGPKTFKLRLSDAIRSCKKLLSACLLSEALQGCFFSELRLLFVCFGGFLVCFQSKEAHLTPCGHDFFILCSESFCIFSLVKFALWSSLAQSPKLHQQKSQ